MAKSSGRLKKAMLSSATSAIYQVVAIVCGFVTSRLIIGAYGSSWNGVLTSITEFLSLFTILEAGVSGSTRVALYKSFAANDLQKTSGIIKANDIFYRRISAFLVVYVGIIALVIPNIVQSEHDKWLIAAMVGVVGFASFAENCFGINSKILLSASQSRYITNIAETISKLANLLALWLIIRFGGPIIAAKAGSSLILAAVPVVLFIITRRMFRIDRHAKPDKSGLKGRWDVIANSLSNIVNQKVDVFFLTFLCASTEVSVYALYYVVAGGLTKVFTVVTNGIEAGFGDMWAKKEYGTLKARLRQFEYIMYSMALLLFGAMIVLIVPFMSVYMRGANDADYQRWMLGLTIGIAEILMSVRTPYVLLVQAAGHYKQVKIAGFIEAGVNIVLTWVLVLRYGIVGAIIGTIVANGFRTLMYGWYSSKHLLDRPFREILYRMLWLSGCLAAAICLSMLVLKLNPVVGWMSWLIDAAATFAIHLAVFLAGSLLFYRKDLRDSVGLVLRRGGKKKGKKAQ